ncbi:hypothetical protein [Tissierella praeacuta]|uniref:hypothetical protein n=1 Tax=Tissierella praeacuta TaxID=43131 RepID=UPI00334258DF
MEKLINEGLIEQLIDHLNKLDFITRIDVIESHAEQVTDAYSDVDLLIKIKDITQDTALYKLTESVKEKFRAVWYDFANSLMPDKFLVSTFIGGNNPFVFYDIGILNSDKKLVYDKTLFENNQWVHLTKLWVMNYKCMMRDAPQFSKRFITMMEKAEISHYSNYRDGFYQLLLRLKEQNIIQTCYLNMLEDVFINNW